MTAVERKKNFLINALYVAVVIALFYLFFKYAFGVLFPFLIAIFIAYILQKPIDAIHKKTRLKKGLLATFFVLFISFLFISLIVLAIVGIGSEIKGFFDYIMLELEDVPAFIEKIEDVVANALSFLPDKLENSVTGFLSEKLSSLLTPSEANAPETSASFDISALATPIMGILNTAKQIPTTLVSIIVAIIACCFMASDFNRVKNILLSLFKKESREKIVRAKRLLFPALAKMAKAYALIMSITFCEVSLGLFLLDLMGIYDGGYIFVIAGITAVVDIVPVLGTGTVVIPWAVYSLFSGNISMAIGLLVMYVCITVIRQIIEPKMVAMQLGIPPFATIIAMYLGSRIFGFIGLFLLPITIVMVKMLNDEGIIHVFHKLEEDEQSD